MSSIFDFAVIGLKVEDEECLDIALRLDTHKFQIKGGPSNPAFVFIKPDDFEPKVEIYAVPLKVPHFPKALIAGDGDTVALSDKQEDFELTVDTLDYDCIPYRNVIGIFYP